MTDRHPQIIVVDPDADFATALSSLLDRRGYHVVRRSFGIDALQYVAEDHPELVVSGVDLPDCDSHELLTSIRKISPATQVLFVAHAPEETEGIVREVDRMLERIAS